MTTVCVFGGTGFLGRRVVRRLAGEGASVRVAVRSPERARSVLDPDRVEVLRADVREPASVAAAVAGADAVVNAVSAADAWRLLRSRTSCRAMSADRAGAGRTEATDVQMLLERVASCEGTRNALKLINAAATYLATVNS